MTLRYEVWTLPWDAGGFKRKIASLPVIEGTGSGEVRFCSTGGEGEAQIAVDEFHRIPEIIGGSVGSLIRVFDGSLVIHEWMASRTPRDILSRKRVANISGPSIEAAFDRAIIYPKEYPDLWSVHQDHIWGGQNVLTDPSMEEAQKTNEKYEVYHDGTGGTFTLTVEGQTTAAIAYDATATTIETELQALSNVQDVIVDVGEGSDRGQKDNPWIVEFIDPAIISPNMTANVGSLTGDTYFRIRTLVQGLGTIPGHWTKSQWADARSEPVLHGRYSADGFKRSPDFAHEGTYSIRVNGLTRYAGLQQVVNVEPGMMYQGSIWVRTTDATEKFKFACGDIYGNFVWDQHIAVIGVANTWVQYNVSFTVPTNRDLCVFRLAAIGNANPFPFYADDASLNEGAPESTPGGIMQDLMDDAVVNHVGDPRGAILDWIDYSNFSTNLDSNGIDWIEPISFTAHFGETYGQILDKFVDMGFEWELRPKTTPSGGLTHDLFLYNEGGRDSAPSTAIIIGQGVTGGEVIKRIPDFTAVMVEGKRRFREEIRSGILTDFGRMEKYISARDVPFTPTLNRIGDKAFADELSNRVAVSVNIVSTPQSHPRPGRDYKPGDTIPFVLPPGMTNRELRRVVAYTYANTQQPTYSVTGSKRLNKEAAAYELTRRMWRRFKPLEIPTRSGRVTGTAEIEGKGPITISFAAGDSNGIERAAANFLCDGDSTDAAVIQAGIDTLDPDGSYELVFFSGTYFLSTPIIINTAANVTFRGVGRPTFDCDDGAFDCVVENAGYKKYVNLAFTGGATSAVILNGGFQLTVEDCYFDTITAKAIIGPHGGFEDAEHWLWVHGCVFADITLSGGGGGSPRGLIWMDNAGDFYFGSVTGCRFEDVSGGDLVDIGSGNSDRIMIYGNHIQSCSPGNEATFFHNWIDGVWTVGDHSVGSGIPQTVSQVATFSKSGILAVAAGTHRFMFPVAGTIVAVRATVGTAPTGSSLIVDVHKNGTTIYSTQANRPTIAVSTNASSEQVPNTTAMADGDYLTVDIDQIGSTIPGSDLTVMVEWRMA